MRGSEDFTNWEAIRTTPEYNEMMVNILFGSLNKEGIFADSDGDKLLDDYNNTVKTVADFREFCKRNKLGEEIGLDVDAKIAEAEQGYLTVEQTPPDPASNIAGAEHLMRLSGTPEVAIEELRAMRKPLKPEIVQ